MANYRQDGPAKRAAMNDSSMEEFTLYARNLPEELNEDGIKEIFKHYGRINGFFHRPNTNWAYITYDTYGEAEAAIKDLNNTPPLRLQVSFSKEKQKLQRAPLPNTNVAVPINVQHENHIETHAVPSSTPNVHVNGRRNLVDVFKKTMPSSTFEANNYTADDDLLYPYPSDQHTYNPYEDADDHVATNTLWTRGQLTLTKDGKRHISLGRGYTLYEIPQSDLKLHEQLSKVYEKRCAGLYEYGKDTLEHAIGKCLRCSKVTKFMCKRCHGFYCSPTCQANDWPTHKTECQPIPELVTAVNCVSLLDPKMEEHTLPRCEPPVQMTLRRPKKHEHTARICNGHNTSKETNNVSDLSVGAGKEILNTSRSKFPSLNAIKQNQCSSKINIEETVTNNIAKDINPGGGRNDVAVEVKVHDKISIAENKTQADVSMHTKSNASVGKKSDSVEDTAKRRPNLSANDATKIEQEIAFEKDTFLSKTEYKDVKIILKTDDSEFYVQTIENDQNLIELMLEVQLEAESSGKVKPVQRNVYAVQYESLWHRALVKSLDPLTVHYIDYGNDEIIKTDDFRNIEKMKHIPCFARKIRLSQKARKNCKDLTFEDTLSVKLVSVDSSGVLNVEVRGENDFPISKPNSTCATSTTSAVQATIKSPVKNKAPNLIPDLKSVISTMSNDEDGILEVHAELSNNIYAVTLLPIRSVPDYEKLLNELHIKCVEMIKTAKHKPSVGDLICGRRFDGDWLRGYILGTETPLKMAIIDEGRVMPIDATLPCPEEYSKISAFGATCKILNAKHKLTVADQCNFKVIAAKHDQDLHEVEIEIVNGDTKVKALLKPWRPLPEQKGVQIAELKSGTEVCLTAFRSHNLLFVQNLDAAEVERCNRIMQAVAKSARTAPLLNEPPVVGQMVLAPYIDHNHYRAIVTKVQDDQVIISYVDFGNMEVTSVKKLKVLPDELKELQSCTAKIVLKDVPRDVAMTKVASDYLCYLTGREIPLICTFDGIPSKDGVVLKTRDGKCVNDKIKESLLQSWHNDTEDDTMVYLMSHLPAVKLGNAGDVVKAIILNNLKDGHDYMICPLDNDLMIHVFETMQNLIEKFCTTTEFYIPREAELCLVLYDGTVWTRAVCLVRNLTASTSSVFLVDIGVIGAVNHTDMRLMPKDFMTPNALASVCKVVNLAPTVSQGEYSPEVTKRVSELVQLMDTVDVKILEASEDDGVYTVELPNIHEKLIQEGLIPA